jgi:hypothetical protein
MNAVDVSEMAFSDDLTNEQIDYELSILEISESVIKGRIAALTELATFKIKNGEIFPNYSLENTLSNREWKSFVNAEFMLALTGKDLTKKILPTPAQAEKAGISETVVNTLTDRRSTGVKLARISADKKAKRILGDRTK